MVRLALTAVGAGLAVVLSGCTSDGSADAVFESVLAATPPTVAGPAFVLLPGRGPASVRTPEGVQELGRVYDATWTTDGHVLAVGGHGMDAIDPTSGEVLGHSKVSPDNVGITPSAVSTLVSWRRTGVTVFAPDLSSPRIIKVPEAAMRTDQADGLEARRRLVGAPLTLDGVTWVEWLLDSEHEEDSDHGLLRIEGDDIRDVQRNEPVVALYASTDGAALLELRQDEGEVDCGTCLAGQNLVELDPRTGEVAASYGMPPGYDRLWRVDAVDKVGDRVAVRFAVETTADVEVQAPVTWQTWVYDGEWAPLDEVGATRTWWQGGGRLVQTRERAVDNVSGGTPYSLTWVAGGETQTLFTPTPALCPPLAGEDAFCPEPVVPGALLPPVTP